MMFRQLQASECIQTFISVVHTSVDSKVATRDASLSCKNDRTPFPSHGVNEAKRQEVSCPFPTERNPNPIIAPTASNSAFLHKLKIDSGRPHGTNHEHRDRSVYRNICEELK